MSLSDFLPPVVGLCLGAVLIVGFDRCDKPEHTNPAIDFIHMVVPSAECKSIETSPYFPSGAATCKAGNFVLYCQAGQFVEPHCIKVADLTPPSAAPAPATPTK